ncbi:MAG: LPS export ABC transporter periplasmic protein LptC [bacterium]
MAFDRKILKRIALILALGFIVLLGFFLVLHYLRKTKGLLNFKISKGYISLKKVDYKFFKKGALTYEIFAKSLDYRSQKKNIIKLNSVRAYIYGKNKKPAFIVTGKSGRLNAVSKNVVITGGVIIRSTKGALMKTDMIDYFAKDDKIAAPGYVKIKGKNYFISGSGLIFYIKKNIFILQKDVHFLSNNARGVIK